MIQFTWYRCLDGYEIKNLGQRKNAKKLNEKSGDWVVPKSDRFETYKPFEMGHALFFQLANSEASPDGALDFVSRYGALSGDPHEGQPVAVFSPAAGVANLILERSENGNFGEVVDLFNRGGIANCHCELTYPSEGNPPQLVWVPDDLLNAIYLQLALHVSAGSQINNCKYCGAPFRVGPGTPYRITRGYCSESHRQMAYQKRTQAKESGNG